MLILSLNQFIATTIPNCGFIKLLQDVTITLSIKLQKIGDKLMTDIQQRAAAKKFAKEWENKGYEKGESQPFWLALLRNVYGVENPEQYISFEDRVKLDNTSYIDGFISETNILIEQKGLGKNLLASIKQSDGSKLTPFQQAKRYSAELPYDKRPRWIIICNFGEFHIYDMNKPQGDPERILLKDLGKEYYRLKFLVETTNTRIKQEVEVSLQAGEIVGKLHKAILQQYNNPEDPETLRHLNILCVRLVFCLYADSAGIFGSRTQFHDYMQNATNKDIEDVRPALMELFRVLDIDESQRDPYLKKSLAAFPYVNGGLFEHVNIEIPHFNEEILKLLLHNASKDFDWSGISPTIFGALFESTLNPNTRRAGGMHYTSIVNIHKVIDPLFLKGLRDELAEIKEIKQQKKMIQSIDSFREKLSKLIFLDPACGSGNFLTETYISLRRLENEALKIRYGLQIALEQENIIKVSIGQFYGFEINDFAVTVAKTALWIAESQMMKETEDIINMELDFLPLKSCANIFECNALNTTWEELVPKARLNYIFGNPPFVGYSYASPTQKEDMAKIFPKNKNLDYVCAWYKKAADLMKGTFIKAAFVSTNSIAQGEQPTLLWKPLMENGVFINFCEPTFKWITEALGGAAVHCVIIGFSYVKTEPNINPYLIEAPTVFIEKRAKPLLDIPDMVFGNKPTDGGHFFLNTIEYKDFIKKEPNARKFIKKVYGAVEYINNIERYCLWLVGAEPAELRKLPLVMERIEKIRELRLKSPKKATQDSAATPMLFQEIRHTENDYIIVPSVSSENRKYIPIGFVSSDIIVTNAVFMIPNATLYHFCILTSNVHMAWTRAVCGRLKSDYRYSNTIVYNNFPWPQATDKQKAEIEKLAQFILDARANHPTSSLADLYDPIAMPPDLLKAHQNLDRAVMKLYGFPSKGFTEADCVAALMEMYQKLVADAPKSK